MAAPIPGGAIKPTSKYEDVFDDDAPAEGKTIQRIRANSSIMQLRKILVANRGEIRESSQLLDLAEKC